MSRPPHVTRVRIYYEDTDFSGVVYHANYLKYFERAREHLLDPGFLVRLYDEQGIGFVVYRAELRFREGARFGDELEIRTTVTEGSAWRLVFDQQAWRVAGPRALVEGTVELCCVDREQRLVRVPEPLMEALKAEGWR
jgi:tol-pal system-associated acyl-CoA thioesterase